MVNRKWDDEMDENSCVTYGEWMRMVDHIKGKTGAVFKNYDPDGTPTDWDACDEESHPSAVFNEDSIILYTEWCNMVAYIKSIEPSVMETLSESYCSLGDLKIENCSSIVTDGSFCNYLHDCGVCTLGDIGISECSSIVTVGNLCAHVGDLCKVGGICPTRAQGNRCTDKAGLAIPNMTVDYFDILSTCSDELDKCYDVAFGIARFNPQWDDREIPEYGYGLGYTIIYGGNSVSSDPGFGESTRALTLNNSLILIPSLPTKGCPSCNSWNQCGEPSCDEPNHFWRSQCSGYHTDILRVYPRLMLREMSMTSLDNETSKNAAIDVSYYMGAEGFNTYKIRFRMENVWLEMGTPTSLTQPFLDFYRNFEFMSGVSESVIESTPSHTDLYLKTNGEGLVKFGEFSNVSGLEVVSNPTITGYIKIKDRDGNVKLLACLDEEFYEEGGGGGGP